MGGGAERGTVLRIRRCAEGVGVAVGEALGKRLAAYLELLQRWNAKLNLTRLDRDDEGVERLLIEPLAALPHVPMDGDLMDIGSGGGSPAIPLKLARPGLGLHMVEARSRKATFLREAIRHLGMDRTRVTVERYERLAERGEVQDRHDVLTVRGVAIDERALRDLQRLVGPGGRLLLFRGAEGAEAWGARGCGFVREKVEPLAGRRGGRLVVLRREQESPDE